MKPALIALIGALTLLAGPHPAAAQDATDGVIRRIFADATRYTVRLRVSIDAPFLGDEHGVRYGTGFVVDRDRRWIVTNAHVTTRSPAKIAVSFKDQEYQTGRRIYADPYLDLAVVELVAAVMPEKAIAAELGCDDEIEAGREVGAFGHPHGIEYSATRGILSGITDRYAIEYLQTDAAINPGNSGGPLIDTRSGRVVGVNTAIVSNSQGIGLAIAIKHACQIVQLLRDNRDPSPPIFPLLLAFKDLKDGAVTVARPLPGPWEGKFLPGDRIRQIDGAPAGPNLTRIFAALRGKEEMARFTVDRGASTLEIDVPLHLQPRVNFRSGVMIAGMVLAPSYAPDAAEIDVADRLVVNHVGVTTPAGIGGVIRGNVLHAVNGRSFSTVEDLHTWLLEQPNGAPLEFILRVAPRDRNFYTDYKSVTVKRDKPVLVK
jgi:S1-C subfamily serine protease